MPPKKTPVCEPLFCDPAAETALHPLVLVLSELVFSRIFVRRSAYLQTPVSQTLLDTVPVILPDKNQRALTRRALKRRTPTSRYTPLTSEAVSLTSFIPHLSFCLTSFIPQASEAASLRRSGRRPHRRRRRNCHCHCHCHFHQHPAQARFTCQAFRFWRVRSSIAML